MIPAFPTIADMAILIQKCELSPVELVESRLQRIEQLDGQLNSFIRVLRSEALADAQMAEKEIAAGNYKGPLHGIPIGLKDIYEMAGIPTTATSARRIDAPAKFAIYEKPMLTIPFNVTGSPAISVCCGYTDTGLPLGLQIVGKRFDELTLLSLAYAYEKATPWHEQHPSLV
jgi:Asp-tRNA(Asn)/Glu-tRNA(Gln) amidotransferase A subunit family amidase